MLDLEPIKARLAAATPETWKSTSFADQYADKYGAWIPSKGWYSQVSGPMWHEKWPGGWAACVDADLIANAPTDLAALVAEVERLRAWITELSGFYDEAPEQKEKIPQTPRPRRHLFEELEQPVTLPPQPTGPPPRPSIQEQLAALLEENKQLRAQVEALQQTDDQRDAFEEAVWHEVCKTLATDKLPNSTSGLAASIQQACRTFLKKDIPHD